MFIPPLSWVTGRARWQHDFRGAGPLSRCATGAHHTRAHTHTLRRQNERCKRWKSPFWRLGVKSLRRDGPRSWLPLGTSAWLCGKDRWGPGGVESISEDVGLTAWCSGKKMSGIRAWRFDGSHEAGSS